jgi:hypothetical protein
MAKLIDVKDNSDSAPTPETIREALDLFKKYIDERHTAFKLLHRLERLFPSSERNPDGHTRDSLVSSFLTDAPWAGITDCSISLGPVGIALLTLEDLFKDTARFEVFDVTKLPEFKQLKIPLKKSGPTYTVIELSGQNITVPVSNILFLEDKKSGVRFVIDYQPSMGGGLVLTIDVSDDHAEKAFSLMKEIKELVLNSPHIKGQVLEMHAGGGFDVLDIGDANPPVMDDELKDNLEKYAINLFDHEEEFKKYGLPVKSAIILAGPPGCGKTMIERWMASKVKGKITTVWVSAKAISNPQDVAEVFDVARKLSPVLLIFEDIDLVAGSREMVLGRGEGSGTGSMCLGEMLNQLDGLQRNESMVVIASTNRVSSLDEAIIDRPGRIDRIFEVSKPSSSVAVGIATEFMRKSNISEETLTSLSLERFFSDGELTGAQVVEVIKGAIFEAIHRDCDLNDLCIKASKDGIEKQRKLFLKKG